jgi:diamine N-acetyltransferase
MLVSLREITASSVRAITELAVAPEQRGFVASNAVSLAEALFSPEAWYRAIYLADEPVGFLMLYDETLRAPPPEIPQIALWRLMIDARYQRQGIGRTAVEQVVAHVRAKRAVRLLTVSYVPGPGCPERFYLGCGFRHTGQLDGGEIVLELPVASESR